MSTTARRLLSRPARTGRSAVSGTSRAKGTATTRLIPEAAVLPKTAPKVKPRPSPPSFEPIIPYSARAKVDLPSSLARIAEMVYPSGTTFWEHESDGVTTNERFNAGCFGVLDYDSAVGVTYLCAPSTGHSITKAHLRFWLRFLRHCLKDHRWTAQIAKVSLRGSKGHLCIVYRLPKLPSNQKTALLYLSLMRYPSEHSRIVKALYDVRTALQSPEEAFKRFQSIHHRDTSFFSPHAAVYTRGDSYDGAPSSTTPVPISTFRANVVSGRKRSVYSHFA